MVSPQPNGEATTPSLSSSSSPPPPPPLIPHKTSTAVALTSPPSTSSRRRSPKPRSRSVTGGGRVDMTNRFHPHHYYYNQRDLDGDEYDPNKVLSPRRMPYANSFSPSSSQLHQHQRIDFASATSTAATATPTSSRRLHSYHHPSSSTFTHPKANTIIKNYNHSSRSKPSQSVTSGQQLEQSGDRNNPGYGNVSPMKQGPKPMPKQHHQQLSSSRCGESKNSLSSCGFSHTWRLWRWCCCRYGWYPLLIAPIITAGCLLSLYSSGGCDFVRIDVGFIPTNSGWNTTQNVNIGLFLYHDDSGIDSTSTPTPLKQIDRYPTTFFDGCQEYSDEFVDSFIDNDRTWTVARIMAYVAGGSSILATATAWLFVFSPLPSFFFWPGVVMPSLLAAFLAEGSKFLFFDTTVCRNNVWFPPGIESSPQLAQSCTLGNNGFIAIAAGAVFFVCLLIACVKSPQHRQLDPSYGYETDYTSNFPSSSDDESAPDFRHSHDRYNHTALHNKSNSNNEDDDKSNSALDVIGNDCYDRRGFGVMQSQLDIDDDIEGSSYIASTSHGRTDSEFGFSVSEHRINNNDNHDENESPSDEEDMKLEPGPMNQNNGPGNGRCSLKNSPEQVFSTVSSEDNDDNKSVVSQSRISTAERMRLNVITSDSSHLIDKFVKEYCHASCSNPAAPDSKQKNDSSGSGQKIDIEAAVGSLKKAGGNAITELSSPQSSEQPIPEQQTEDLTLFQTLCVGQQLKEAESYT